MLLCRRQDPADIGLSLCAWSLVSRSSAAEALQKAELFPIHPYHDLVIYEMGAGNGTLMLNVLDHIRDIYPDVYERTKYKIIEVSSALASLQEQLEPARKYCPPQLAYQSLQSEPMKMVGVP